MGLVGCVVSWFCVVGLDLVVVWVVGLYGCFDAWFCGWGLDLWRSVWLGVCWLFSLVGGCLGSGFGVLWVGNVGLFGLGGLCWFVFGYFVLPVRVRVLGVFWMLVLSCVGCSVDLLLW